jgi:hypothetical protein
MGMAVRASSRHTSGKLPIDLLFFSPVVWLMLDCRGPLVVGQEWCMEPLQAQDIAERDQLWANLRVLRSEIERIAEGEFDSPSREQQLAVLLARIVLAELDYRAREGSAV